MASSSSKVSVRTIRAARPHRRRISTLRRHPTCSRQTSNAILFICTTDCWPSFVQTQSANPQGVYRLRQPPQVGREVDCLFRLLGCKACSKEQRRMNQVAMRKIARFEGRFPFAHEDFDANFCCVVSCGCYSERVDVTGVNIPPQRCSADRKSA